MQVQYLINISLSHFFRDRQYLTKMILFCLMLILSSSKAKISKFSNDSQYILNSVIYMLSYYWYVATYVL